MGRHAAALILGLMVLGIGLGGCSEEAGGPVGRALDRRVLALKEGMSVEAVRSQLGPPVSENTNDGTTLLIYDSSGGVWRLVFTDDGLERWTREFPPGRQTIHGKVLDREVLALRPGLSIGAVEAKLGEAGLHTIEYEPERVESLWYDGWQITFIDGRLDTRTDW